MCAFKEQGHVAVSINQGSLLQVSSQQERYYVGSALGPLIYENFHVFPLSRSTTRHLDVAKLD